MLILTTILKTKQVLSFLKLTVHRERKQVELKGLRVEVTPITQKLKQRWMQRKRYVLTVKN